MRTQTWLAAFVAPLLPMAAAAQGVSGGGVTIPVPQGRAEAAASGAAAALALEAGSGRVLSLPGAASNIFVADPKVAEVRPASPTALFVFGVGPGRTTVAALSAEGRPITQYTVTVRPSAYGAGEASAAIARQMPGSQVRIQTTQNGLAVTGEVATPAQAEQAVAIARGYVERNQTVENRLHVTGGTQVLLRVRIAEMARSVTRQLGVSWQAVGSLVGRSVANPLPGAGAALAGAQFAVGYLNKGVNVDAIIDALAQDNLARLLAEPNLTAMSGETANFLSGGEYPIPVSQALGTTSVTYKDYGVSLSFVPTVLSENRISLRVRPEVSQLTTAGAVTVSSGGGTLSIPALTVRRAETTVELGSGQSFAIAGLLQDNATQSSSGIPILGDIPGIGGLFRTDSLQRDQTELVLVVTPFIVRPVSDPTAIRIPGEGFNRPGNDLERLFLQRQTNDTTPRLPATRLPGDVGFIMQ